MVCGDVIQICSERIQRDNNGRCVFRAASSVPFAPFYHYRWSLYIVMRIAFQICTPSTTAPIARMTSRGYASNASSAPNSTFACRWVNRSDSHFESRDSLASLFLSSTFPFFCSLFLSFLSNLLRFFAFYVSFLSIR